MQTGELLTDKNITAKEFGKKVNEKLLLTGNNSSSWSNRSLDWYNSERRLIFAVDPESMAFKNLNQEFFGKVSKNGVSIVSAQTSCGVWSQFLSPAILQDLMF